MNTSTKSNSKMTDARNQDSRVGKTPKGRPDQLIKSSSFRDSKMTDARDQNPRIDETTKGRSNQLRKSSASRVQAEGAKSYGSLHGVPKAPFNDAEPRMIVGE